MQLLRQWRDLNDEHTYTFVLWEKIKLFKTIKKYKSLKIYYKQGKKKKKAKTGKVTGEDDETWCGILEKRLPNQTNSCV